VSWYGSAQAADPSLTFDVASVKMTGTGPISGRVGKGDVASVQAPADSTRFSKRNATLASLLLTAYRLPWPQQLIGPEWLTSERYEIEARAPEGATAEQRLVMLQNLLAERFRVKVHRESNEMPVYELVIAKRGVKLKATTPDESALPPFQQGPLHLWRSEDGVLMTSLGERGTMQGLANRLSGYVDRPILERTGLKGDYDFVMRWTPMTQSSSAAAAASDPGISIFAAFESQLGLKLEPKKGMVEVLVVDHAERVPTEN
jgi:uncharacterized protein (TIGR03435 family)